MRSRGGRGRPQLSRYIRLLAAVLFYNADSYRETVAVRRQREGWRERVINPSRAVVRLSSRATAENPQRKDGREEPRGTLLCSPFPVAAVSTQRRSDG
jgi:hypothetical protein